MTGKWFNGWNFQNRKKKSLELLISFYFIFIQTFNLKVSGYILKIKISFPILSHKFSSGYILDFYRQWMGRTTPSFRIASILEEQEGISYQKHLNKEDKKLFKEMLSIARLYNGACSYSVNPFWIYPIFMSIIFHNYKKLRCQMEKKKTVILKIKRTSFLDMQSQ